MMNPSTSSTKSYLVKGTSAEKRMIGILARRRRQSSPIILLIEVGQVWDNCYHPHPSSSIQLYVIFSCPGLGSRQKRKPGRKISVFLRLPLVNINITCQDHVGLHSFSNKGKVTLTAISIGVRRATMVKEHPTPNLPWNIDLIEKATSKSVSV